MSLVRLDGDELDVHYRHILIELAKSPGTLGVIFRKAQNKIQDPAKLKRLVVGPNRQREVADPRRGRQGRRLRGPARRRMRRTSKSGAGQYFTPRALIRAIVDVMQPAPGNTVCDPAAGTGGFLLAAYDYIEERATRP